MRDVEGTDEPFGGRLVLVLAGDFRQLLPVVRRGDRGTYNSSCLGDLKYPTARAGLPAVASLQDSSLAASELL
jgi:hypothetical protein